MSFSSCPYQFHKHSNLVFTVFMCCTDRACR
uniref:Uncharacterized protein n=1 Tax=Anguilla anguilla TaxID=7936 RepID=A0A0E9T520_ANGAN